MAADVVELPTQRTYTVPRAIAASAAFALNGNERHHDAALARRLIHGRANLDDVVRIHDGLEDTGFELRGGEYGQVWAERIVAGLAKDQQRATDDALTRFGYDPETWQYAGITSPTDEDVIVDLVRYPVDAVSLQGVEALTAGGEWHPVTFDFEGEDKFVYGVAMDPDLMAFTASALMEEGIAGVMLAYAPPYCFLEQQPLLAAGAIAPAPDDASEHVYAIVDSTDTTAVVDLIMLTSTPEGPAVWRRNGGMWQLEPTMLDTFLSSTPPPIVELQSPTKEQVISQVDASSANQVETDEEGMSPEAGPGIETAMTQPKAKKSDPHGDKAKKARPDRDIPGREKDKRAFRTPKDGTEEGPGTKPPRDSTVAKGARPEPVAAAAYNRALLDIDRAYNTSVAESVEYYYTDAGYKDGFDLNHALTAAAADRTRREIMVRTHSMRQAYREMAEIRRREQEFDHVLLPARPREPLVAGVKHPGVGNAEVLRRYWVDGKGALKIRWNTHGDWRRCERHLRKYLGEGAKGWCQLRHREATGVYTGDKRNV